MTTTSRPHRAPVDDLLSLLRWFARDCGAMRPQYWNRRGRGGRWGHLLARPDQIVPCMEALGHPVDVVTVAELLAQLDADRHIVIADRVHIEYLTDIDSAKAAAGIEPLDYTGHLAVFVHMHPDDPDQRHGDTHNEPD